MIKKIKKAAVKSKFWIKDMKEKLKMGNEHWVEGFGVLWKYFKICIDIDNLANMETDMIAV